MRRFGLEEVAQLPDRGTCLGELELEAIEVLDDQSVARVGVRRGEHGLDVGDRHVQGPESSDDLGDGDLTLGVVAIAVVLVHLAWLEQPHLVVVVQRLDAQVRGAGEVADRDARSHEPSIDPPPAGGSTADLVLDPPASGGDNLAPSRPSAGASNHHKEDLMSPAAITPADLIRRYFELDAGRDINAIVALFTDDASVIDEGDTHHGTAEIRAWQLGAAAGEVAGQAARDHVAIRRASNGVEDLRGVRVP